MTSREGQILVARDLRVHFPARGRKDKSIVRAVDGVDLDVRRGETVGLVGESGSGKTTIINALVNAVPTTTGSITLDGTAIDQYSRLDLARIAQMVFQDPGSSLDPRRTIGWTIGEPLVLHGEASPLQRKARVEELLSLVGLPSSTAPRYPHQLSGGQKQRVAIARALALSPELLLCDEPVSALDVSIQTQILRLLIDLQERLGVSILFVAHDIAVVKGVSHRIVVLYVGKVMEVCESDDIADPLHPYTKALISAVPTVNGQSHRLILSGELPDPADPPPGCRFQTRCPWAQERCRIEEPALRPVRDQPERRVACHYFEEISSGANAHD